MYSSYGTKLKLQVRDMAQRTGRRDICRIVQRWNAYLVLEMII